MQSTFAGIELGKRALSATTQALSTIGHNLSNASTEGYSRQRVELRATDPLYRPQLNRAERPGQVGQGVDVARVERVRDELLDRRIVARAGGEGYWGKRSDYLLMIEQVYNEPEEVSVRSLMDRFWDGWQELSLYPDQSAPRRVLAERADTLVAGIRNRYQELDRVRQMLEDEITVTVGQVNDITTEIAELNREIIKSEAMGDSPNDLYDRRDLLTDRLATIIDISVDTRDPDEFSIHTAGYHIVQGGISRQFDLESDPDNEGFNRIVWAEYGEAATFRGGSLAALVELRDVDVRDQIRGLDDMTVNFVNMVNHVHRRGVGLDGRSGLDFFVEYPFVDNARGNVDTNGDGTMDSTYLFQVSGGNRLDEAAEIGLSGTMRLSGPDGALEIPYFPADTVRDVIGRINTSGAEVTARLNDEGMLTLKATSAADGANPDFVLREIADDGQFLVGYSGLLIESGDEGAFRWDSVDSALAFRGDESRYTHAPRRHPAGWVNVNPALRRQTDSIAAGFADAGGRPVAGDGEIARRIADLRTSEVMVGSVATFDDYFADAVAEIGAKGAEAEIARDTEELVMKDLRDLRASISGVNIDEELAQLIKYQHGYTAAARFVTTVNSMLDLIINRMGV